MKKLTSSQIAAMDVTALKLNIEEIAVMLDLPVNLEGSKPDLKARLIELNDQTDQAEQGATDDGGETQAAAGEEVTAATGGGTEQPPPDVKKVATEAATSVATESELLPESVMLKKSSAGSLSVLFKSSKRRVIFNDKKGEKVTRAELLELEGHLGKNLVIA